MDNINYIQRSSIDSNDLLNTLRSLEIKQKQSIFFRITEINAPEKAEEKISRKIDRLVFEDVLAGMNASGTPLAFFLLNKGGSISIQVGTWAEDRNKLIIRGQLLASLLHGSQSYINYEEIDYRPYTNFQKTGLVLGFPCSKIESDNTLPIDRLLQSMGSSDWQCLIMAEPNDDAVVSNQINNLLNDLRQTQTAVADSKVPNPVAEHYAELLKAGLQHLQLGKEIGSWQTSVYLAGDAVSYYQLSGIWKSAFAGELSRPQPIIIHEESAVGGLIARLQSIAAPGTPGPGIFKHPFQYKSILNSRQLSAYIHLPKVETPGISLIKICELDTVPPKTETDKVIALGNIIQRKRTNNSVYKIDLRNLCSHAFVTGTTGGGKTTTIFNILLEARKFRSHFLVIESAKKEYRALKNHPVFEDMQVFTLGNENIAPFRLNPFEVMPGMSVSTHLDLLKSVFNASFGMWTPLPQVLEQCLYRIYEDRGWDLSYNINSRVQSPEDLASSFPTLTDLYNKVDIVTSELGYDSKTRDDIQAALSTRINSLRTGGKGKMMDTQKSIPMDILLGKATVLEMEAIGDDEDKAFLIGILFIRLVEFRRTQPLPSVPHLLVIEEAHHLLSNPESVNGEESGNLKAKAVETFTDLLAEIRSYNQGIIIADQIPTKLAPEIIKNTNLKIVHRIISKDDREVLAGAMAMEEKQSVNLVTLARGSAVVFSQGDDAPLLLQIPNIKTELSMPTDESIRTAMKALLPTPNFDHVAAIISAMNNKKNAIIQICYDASKKISEKPAIRRAFVRLILAVTADGPAINDYYPLLVSRIKSYMKDGDDEYLTYYNTLGHLSEWFTTLRGDQHRWGYTATRRLLLSMHTMLLARLNNDKDLPALNNTFVQNMQEIHGRNFEPFLNCSKVCNNESGKLVCLYRYAVQDLIMENGAFETPTQTWQEALDQFESAKNEKQQEDEVVNDEKDTSSTDGNVQTDQGLIDAVNIALGAAALLVPAEVDRLSAMKISMCYAIQMDTNTQVAGTQKNFDRIYQQCLLSLNE